ncbi:hypothetical protein D3C86_1482630 [compost metagenome]
MHYPQRGVAVLQAVSDDAHRTHVEQFVKSEMLFLHFAPDAVDVLRTTIDFSPHVLFFHRLAQAADELIDVMLTIDTTLVQQFRNSLVFRRMQIAEAVIFQLPFQLADT